MEQYQLDRLHFIQSYSPIKAIFVPKYIKKWIVQDWQRWQGRFKKI